MTMVRSPSGCNAGLPTRRPRRRRAQRLTIALAGQGSTPSRLNGVYLSLSRLTAGRWRDLPTGSSTRLCILHLQSTHHPLPVNQFLVKGTMSNPPTPASNSHSNFQSIFHASLKAYEKQTKKNLLSHPLAVQLHSCDSPTTILTVLQDQVREFEQSRSVDERLTKWLNPTVNVLYAFSATLGEGVGLVFSPAKVIFAGAGVLLLAAKDVKESQDALVDIFERVENFFKRLETYTEVPPTAAMTDIIVKIMVEVLGILAISTKEIKQGRTKKYLKKLAGRTEIEDALKRLDKLTQEEARMAAAQLLKIAHNVENKVTQVIDDGKEARAMAMEARATAMDSKAILQQAASSVDNIKWTQVRQELRKWVSPPDPSTNHNIACDASHRQTADWFFEGSKIKEWKSTGSLLWIHGKPGAGKSILCSSVIQDAFVLRDAGLASVAYFYFDFRDTDKQSRHDLLLSLVSQLSARSDPCCEILFRLYVSHDNGAHKPRDDVLVRCLKEMLALLVQSPTYLIVDALDECPNTSGIPSARARAIELVKELLGLRLPNLRVCITSRPEIDIKASLGLLASHSVSLHEEIGQKQDIADYIKSVVYSDSDTMMSRWREDEKSLVVETLSERADGMFRWVFCQLEALQGCLPASVRRTLNELPESLDKTYERILKEIKRPSRDHAHRLLQCLTVAIRPLRVEELAELLAYDFDAAEEGIPKVDPNWRWKDHEEAVLSTCSSLIAVVNHGDSQVVQFSHFSVKEFLTSDRLATSGGDAAHYHISLGLAHTLLVQACLGTLLSLDNEDGGSHSTDGDVNNFPLASYAAQHWTAHSRVDKALSRIQGGMQQLFDPTKPHFAAWVKLYNVEDQFWSSKTIVERMATPLYYAALCGFHGLVEHHLIKYPEHVNALGGGRGAALHAASAQGHIKVAQVILGRDGDVDVRGTYQRTPLQFAALEGHVEMGRFLLDQGADVDSRTDDPRLWTPLHLATWRGHVGVSQMLLEHKADANSRSDNGRVPLHRASENSNDRGDYPGVVRVLLEYGADVDVKDNEDTTPLDLASSEGKTKIVRLLLDHGADVDAKDKEYMTPLHKASSNSTGVVRLLLDHGANVNAEDKDGRTPFQVASSSGEEDVAQMLIEYGAQLHEEQW